MAEKGYSKSVNKFVGILAERVKDYYGDNLVSFVVFGSVARGTTSPDSDIDCLIVADAMPKGRMKRVDQFYSHVEKPLTEKIGLLAREGVHVDISPVFKTPEEVMLGSPLFLDMIFDALILFDRDKFFAQYLEKLRKKLERLGSRRVMRGNSWYWVLKPDYKPGDVIEL